MVRSRLAVTFIGVAAMAGSVLAAGPAAATSHRSHSCPKAESLVPQAHLKTRTLGKGLTLSEGVAHDAQGSVHIHVLRADLTNRHLSVGPLVRSLAERSPLSKLASHRHHLVAATNTGYFDFRTGAPEGPLITHRAPVILSTRHESVAGIGTNGRAQAGEVWLSGQVTSRGSSYRLSALNELDPPSGLVAYTRAWGSQVWVRGRSDVRTVVHGVVGAGSSHSTSIPLHGRLLVATSQSAQQWLDSLHTGASLSTTVAVHTSTSVPFAQAYGVGLQIVAQAGHVLTGFGCDSAGTQTPARTSIGYAKGGKQLIIALVDDHPGTTVHGLDENQMSELMVQVGASHAYAFDGSGSTELLARMPGVSGLSLRTYPADGEERPMPLGLGIFTTT